MDLVVPLERVTVAIEGAVARFPVRRIYCVSRNYLDHIRETAGAEGREPPLFFQKLTVASRRRGLPLSAAARAVGEGEEEIGSFAEIG